MSSIIARQAVFSELEELAQLFNLYRVFQGKANDLAAARAFLKARFDHGESVVFIAHEGAVPVGFAQLYPSYSSTALARVFTLNDLFVHESSRRKGVGATLLASVEGYAWSHGAVRVTLNVAIENTSGQALYERRAGAETHSSSCITAFLPRHEPWRAVGPNPSLKRSANGRPPGPGLRYGVHFLSPGPGVLPLASA